MINFENIIFDEFTLLEGEQAESYKANKEKEKSDSHKKESERMERRRYAGVKNKTPDYDDFERHYSASEKAHKMMKDNNRDMQKDYLSARDAANRHERRHG